MSLSRKFRLAVLLLILGCTVGCDQVSKHVARNELKPPGSVVLLGGLGELRLTENPGAFLSIGGSMRASWRFAVLTVGVGITLAGLFAYLVWNLKLESVLFGGLALVLAGGVSNLIDRITRDGFVTDFVLLRLGPLQTGVFNWADVMIMLGMAILLYDALKRNRSPRQISCE